MVRIYIDTLAPRQVNLYGESTHTTAGSTKAVHPPSSSKRAKTKEMAAEARSIITN